jgi:hypothetical protein
MVQLVCIGDAACQAQKGPHNIHMLVVLIVCGIADATEQVGLLCCSVCGGTTGSCRFVFCGRLGVPCSGLLVKLAGASTVIIGHHCFVPQRQ